MYRTAWLLAGVVLCAGGAFAQGGMPRIKSVTPRYALAGEEVTLGGENLSKKTVPKVFLTQRNEDTLLTVTEQTDTAIKCKLPAEIASGRYSFTLLTSGDNPAMIEQPVRVEVETEQQRKARLEKEAQRAEPAPEPAPAPPAKPPGNA